MYSHPETMFLLATEVQKQYLADAEQHRLLRRVRRDRRARRNVRQRQ